MKYTLLSHKPKPLGGRRNLSRKGDLEFMCKMLQMSVPGPGFLRGERVVFSEASSCSKTRRPTGILSYVCVWAASDTLWRAVTVESRGGCGCFSRGIDREAQLPAQGIMKLLRTEPSRRDFLLKEVLGARRGCPDLSYCRSEICRCDGHRTQHSLPAHYDIQHDYCIFKAPMMKCNARLYDQR